MKRKLLQFWKFHSFTIIIAVSCTATALLLLFGSFASGLISIVFLAIVFLLVEQIAATQRIIQLIERLGEPLHEDPEAPQRIAHNPLQADHQLLLLQTRCIVCDNKKQKGKLVCQMCYNNFARGGGVSLYKFIEEKLREKGELLTQ